MAKAEKHICCFTGHRPEKLNCDEATVKAMLRNAIAEAVQEDYNTFISADPRASISEFGIVGFT